MALRFTFLFVAGLIVGSALLYSDNEDDLRRPITKKPALMPQGPWPYRNYAGFCYIENSLGGSEYTRGDLFLWGQKRGQQIEVRGALYKLRGAEKDNVVLEVRGGRGFQTIRSRPLGRSRTWQKVPWQSRLPRLVAGDSGGEFSFNFDGTLLDRNCAWSFRF